MTRVPLSVVYASACCAVLLNSVPASAVTLEWIRTFGTPQPERFATGKMHSSDDTGNVYITGGTDGNLAATNAGNDDVFLSKYDAAGNPIWTRQIGSIQRDRGHGVSMDDAGNVFIAGYTGDHANNDGLFGLKDGAGDAFLTKYDSAGSQLWARQFSLGNYDGAYDVSVDNMGHVYVAGFTAQDPAASLALLAKFDLDGNQLWARGLDIDSTGRDWAYGITNDQLGNILVSGHSGAGEPVFVAKYDNDGNQLWLRRPPDAQAGFHGVGGLATDDLGNVYITGSTVPFAYDIYVTKYDANGVLQWNLVLGTPSADNPRDIVFDGRGNLYVSGLTGGNLDGAHPAGGASAFLAKFDADSGEHQWSLQFGDGEAWAVSADSSGIIHVSGIVADDVFIAKFSDPIPEPSALVLAALALTPASVWRRGRTREARFAVA